ncbi:MAG TPA: DUF2784 domain-containing protein [Acidimicrobiales bacterium]
MAWLVLARITALAHLSYIAFLVVGGPLSVRRPRVLPFHAAALASAIAVNVTGSDCPLTAAEKDLLARAGEPVYEGGFNSHYLVEPIRPAGIDGTVNLVMLTLLCVPTVGSYALVLRRRRSTSVS